LIETPARVTSGLEGAFVGYGKRPPGIKERARYFAALDRLVSQDAEVRRLITEILHLVQPLSVLEQEPLRSRVLSRMTI
jgi:hypothetical protein